MWHEYGMGKNRRLVDEYRFPGFRPRSEIKGVFGDQKARVIRLERRQKKQCVEHAEKFIGAITIRKYDVSEIDPVERPASTWNFKSGVSIASSVEK